MKYLTLIVICVLAFGCNNNSIQKTNETDQLLAKIKLLEEQNQKLKDSISRDQMDFLHSQILIGISDDEVLKVGKKNNIVMLVHTYNRELPKYEIYTVVDNKEVKIGENNQIQFNFEFIPKSVKDNSPEIFLKMQYKGEIIKIPGKLLLKVEK